MSYCLKHQANKPGESQSSEVCLQCKYEAVDKNKVCCFCGREGHYSKDCPDLAKYQGR